MMFPIEQADQVVLDCLEQFCHGELYRLIDVDNDMVYDYQDGELKKVCEPCYLVWKRQKPCINCISRRALKERKLFIKMEMVGGHVYLVCASPIMIKSRNLSLETIWDITESLTTDDTENGEDGLLQKLIERINLSLVQDIYTGLYNKSYAEHELKDVIRDWREDRPLVVVMMDIDRFKEVNDQYGHVQGDIVIKKLADMFLECASTYSGTACRVGGDEFLMIVQGLSLEKIKQAVGLLKERISEFVFGQEHKFHITISAGVAEYSPDMDGWKPLVDKADQLMYQEKKKRRR